MSNHRISDNAPLVGHRVAIAVAVGAGIILAVALLSIAYGWLLLGVSPLGIAP